MTPKPTMYEGLKEKLFWLIISSIGTGVIAMVGMVWNLSVEVKIMQHDNGLTMDLVKESVQMSTANNAILKSKADDSTNKAQHRLLVGKLDSVQSDLQRLTKKYPIYGLKYPKELPLVTTRFN